MLRDMRCRGDRTHLEGTAKSHKFLVEGCSYVLSWADVWELLNDEQPLERVPVTDKSGARILCSKDGCTEYIEWRRVY